MHAPSTHTPPPQSTPQAPQFSGSDLVSTHWPLQPVRGAAHTQVPLTHSWPSAHWLPHPPQLSGSFWVSAQAPPHWVVPRGHIPAMHCPPAQTSPMGQPLPQAPQLFGSESRLVQNPLHSTAPMGQLLTHCPPTH